MRIRTSELGIEEPVGILREQAEVFVDTARGLSEVCGGVVDCDGQIAKFRRESCRLANFAIVLFRGRVSWHVMYGQAGHPVPQETDRLRLGERRDFDAISLPGARPVPLPQGKDDVPFRPTGRKVSFHIKRIGDVVVNKEPALGSCLKFPEYGRDCPVATAVRTSKTRFEPPSQVDQGFPYAVMMLGANPPDNVIFVYVTVDIFSS
jgi:hypothetical protein